MVIRIMLNQSRPHCEILETCKCGGEVLLQVCNYHSTALIQCAEILMGLAHVFFPLSLQLQKLECIMNFKLVKNLGRNQAALFFVVLRVEKE